MAPTPDIIFPLKTKLAFQREEEAGYSPTLSVRKPGLQDHTRFVSILSVHLHVSLFVNMFVLYVHVFDSVKQLLIYFVRIRSLALNKLLVVNLLFNIGYTDRTF